MVGLLSLFNADGYWKRLAGFLVSGIASKSVSGLWLYLYPPPLTAGMLCLLTFSFSSSSIEIISLCNLALSLYFPEIPFFMTSSSTCDKHFDDSSLY